MEIRYEHPQLRSTDLPCVRRALRPGGFGQGGVDMVATRVIVIGAGSGGIAAMRRILSALPADFDAAMVLLIHSAPEEPDPLAQLVQREGRFRV